MNDPQELLVLPLQASVHTKSLLAPHPHLGASSPLSSFLQRRDAARCPFVLVVVEELDLYETQDQIKEILLQGRKAGVGLIATASSTEHLADFVLPNMAQALLLQTTPNTPDNGTTHTSSADQNTKVFICLNWRNKAIWLSSLSFDNPNAQDRV